MHWITHLYLHQPCHCTFMAYLGVACCRSSLNPALFAGICSWVRQIPSIYIFRYPLYRWSQFCKPVRCSLILQLPWLSYCIFPSALQRIYPREEWTGPVNWWAGAGQTERCNPVGGCPDSFTYHQITKSFFPSAKHFPFSHVFFPTRAFCFSLLTLLPKSHSVSADWSGSILNI